MTNLTEKQKLDYENIRFHLVDLKNTINDPIYTKKDYLRELTLLIAFIDHKITL